MEITKDDRRQGPVATPKVVAIAAVLAVAAGAAFLMPGGKADGADVSVDGLRTYRLSELADKCPGVRPMLADALADDRILASEAAAIEDEGRRLHGVSSDARFHNAARRSAGLKPNAEPVVCDIPFQLRTR